MTTGRLSHEQRPHPRIIEYRIKSDLNAPITQIPVEIQAGGYHAGEDLFHG
jgi:hypothetical protein